MELREDETTFDELQIELKNRLGRAIMARLDKIELDRALLDKLCDQILFDITEVLDAGEEPLSVRAKEAYPVITFCVEADGELITAADAAPSSMQEYAMGTAEFLRKEGA